MIQKVKQIPWQRKILISISEQDSSQTCFVFLAKWVLNHPQQKKNIKLSGHVHHTNNVQI